MRRLVVLLGLVGLLGVGCAQRGPEVVAITAQPTDAFAGAASPSPSPSPPPSPSPSPSEGTPSPTPSETAARPATDTDQARFVEQYAPEGAEDLEHVAADLDGDGEEELVFAYVGSGSSRLDVAWWSGTAYEVTFRGTGGEAVEVTDLGVADVNRDGRTELLAHERGEGERASVTLWRVEGPGEVAELPAVGGCHDGSNTYGVVGASLEDRDADGAQEIYATCDDAPLPVGDWSTDRYVWSGGAYRHAPQIVR